MNSERYQRALDAANHEFADAAWRAAPAGAGLGLYNMTLNDIVGLVTIIYLVIQIFLLIPKAAKVIREWRGSE